MLHIKIYQSALLVVLSCAFFHIAEAKDMSTLQTSLALAQENLEKAKNRHDTSAVAVVHQKQIVEEQKRLLAEANKQLEKLQQDEKQTSEQFLEAKQKYEKAQSDFKAAWESNK